MNEVLTINYLIDRLISSGISKDNAERIVIELFRQINESLPNEDVVQLKGLGEFILSENNQIEFAPDSFMNEKLNEPFSMFDAIELDEDSEVDLFIDEVPIEEMPENTASDDSGDINDNSEFKKEATPTQEEMAGIALENQVDQQTLPDQLNDDENSNVVEEISEYPAEVTEGNSDEVEIPLSANETTLANFYIEDEEKSAHLNRRKLPFLLFMLGLFLGVVIGFFLSTYRENIMHFFNKGESNEYTDIENPVVELTDLTVPLPESDSDTNINTADGNEDLLIEEGPDSNQSLNSSNTVQSQQDVIVTDTVTSTNYLATMARRHYGRFEFWVYIYKENESRLGHPDKIEPNTVVVIPPADKYHIDKNSSESLNRAEQLANEIYARF